MPPSSRTPEGEPNRCPVCGHDVLIEPKLPVGDAACPNCGQLLWFPMSAGSWGLQKFRISDPGIRTKSQAIAAILDRLIETDGPAAGLREDILAAILEREELGSTGIGRGVAVPHAKCDGISRLFGAVAEFPAGVDFESLDRRPVRVVYLIVSPKNRPAEHLRILESIAQHLRRWS
jgi:PTS system fructose-specific IIA component/PTS system nitrogen regulatory IIA component